MVAILEHTWGSLNASYWNQQSQKAIRKDVKVIQKTWEVNGKIVWLKDYLLEKFRIIKMYQCGHEWFYWLFNQLAVKFEWGNYEKHDFKI